MADKLGDINRISMKFSVQTPDELLLPLLKKGDNEAFSIIFQKYNKLLYVFAYRYLKDQVSAEEIVQVVFVRLWEYHAELMIEINLRNYLYTMVKNNILNEIRHQNVMLVKHYEMAQKIPTYEDNLLQNIEDREMQTLLYAAIMRLPEQKKKVCLLRVHEGLSNQEVAERMHLSLNTVKTHYAQAIRMLRASLLHFTLWILWLFM